MENTFAVQAACGQQHTLVLDKDGNVWSWGLSVFGQCGHNSLHDEKLPRKIDTFANPSDATEAIQIQSIACGSHHSLALDTCVHYRPPSFTYLSLLTKAAL
jgi:alpha-tubulin suppressor-like RCC1 family protein